MNNGQYDPELSLSHAERGHLAALASMEGYRVLHRLFKAEADKYIVALINAPVDDRNEIVGRHMLAKAAASYYTAICERVNTEISQYTQSLRKDSSPVDYTEETLDIGEMASIQDDFHSIHEEEY